MTSLKSEVKLTLMKKLSLYIFLVLMFCNVGVAEIVLKCDVEVHVKNYEFRPEENENIAYNKWLDLDPYSQQLTIKKNKIISITNAFIELGLPGNTYKIIRNDQRYLVGEIIERDPEGITVDHLIYDKKFNFLSQLYYSDYGVAIYEGFCN